MKQYDATEIAYKNGYEKGKADAAQEIFEEIEELLKVHRISVHFNNYDAALTDVIAERKKKYTEDK